MFNWGFVSVLVTMIVSTSSAFAADDFTSYTSADIQSSLECVLKLTAKIYRPKADIGNFPLPKLIVDTDADLKTYQEAVAPQLGIKPDKFLNVYLPDLNTIYLVSSYSTAKTGRTPYDSLAHEFTHYLQFFVDQTKWSEMTDLDEENAVRVQTQFRETYASQIQNGKFVCPN